MTPRFYPFAEQVQSSAHYVTNTSLHHPESCWFLLFGIKSWIKVQARILFRRIRFAESRLTRPNGISGLKNPPFEGSYFQVHCINLLQGFTCIPTKMYSGFKGYSQFQTASGGGEYQHRHPSLNSLRQIIFCFEMYKHKACHDQFIYIWQDTIQFSVPDATGSAQSGTGERESA